MNKKELVAKIAEATGTSKVQAEKQLNATLEIITASLQSGVEVPFFGFGTFKVRDKKERMGRNPATGETIKIPAKKTVHFNAGSRLKNAVSPKVEKKAKAKEAKKAK